MGDLEAQTYLLLSEVETSEDLSISYLNLALGRATSSGNQELEWEAAYRLGKRTHRFELIAQARDILTEMASGLDPHLRRIFLSNELRNSCLNTTIPDKKPDPSRPTGETPAFDDGDTSVMADHRYLRLLEINKKLNGVHQIDTLLEHILDTALELLSGDRGFLLTTDDGPLRIRTARQISKNDLQKPEFQLSMSIARKVVEEGKPVITLDALNSPEFQESKSVHALQLRSVLCVPLTVRGITLGAIYVDNPRVQAMFTDADCELLIAFADQAALALEQARMRSQLQQELEVTNITLASAQEELSQVRIQLNRDYTFGQIVGGKDPAMASLLKLLQKVAKGSSSVLIRGESGTGKELVARAIHSEGALVDEPFLTVNCAAFSGGTIRV